MNNKYEISHHNLNFDHGIASFKMDVNEYSDLSHEEFVAQMKRRVVHFEYDIE